MVSDSTGESVTSEAATLTEKTETGVAITKQPESVAGVTGTTVTFKVEATGENLSYQWQYQAAGSESWLKSGLTGNKTAELSVPVSGSRIGMSFRCVICNDTQTIISDAAVLTLK